MIKRDSFCAQQQPSYKFLQICLVSGDLYIMSVLPNQNAEESFNNQKQKVQGGRSSTYEIKIPDLQFLPSENANANFQLEVCRLVQANSIMTQLIKQAALEKYSLSEKIHLVLEQIKKLQAKNAAK